MLALLFHVRNSHCSVPVAGDQGGEQHCSGELRSHLASVALPSPDSQCFSSLMDSEAPMGTLQG